MAIVIDEFEVVVEPASTPSGPRGVDGAAGQNPPDPRPVQLQRAIEQWAALSAERALRLDDR